MHLLDRRQGRQAIVNGLDFLIAQLPEQRQKHAPILSSTTGIAFLMRGTGRHSRINRETDDERAPMPDSLTVELDDEGAAFLLWDGAVFDAASGSWKISKQANVGIRVIEVPRTSVKTQSLNRSRAATSRFSFSPLFLSARDQ